MIFIWQLFIISYVILLVISFIKIIGWNTVFSKKMQWAVIVIFIPIIGSLFFLKVVNKLN